MEQTRFTPLEATHAVEQAARHHHYEAEITAVSFWENAAAALPPHVRRRYARLFEAAEHYEPFLHLIVDGCAAGGRALGRLMQPKPGFREVGRASLR
jgi:hypothetical protein